MTTRKQKKEADSKVKTAGTKEAVVDDGGETGVKELIKAKDGSGQVVGGTQQVKEGQQSDVGSEASGKAGVIGQR
jgi:hypothetical protein